MLELMLSRRLPWLLALSWVACGKLAGFEDLQGTGGSAGAHHEGGDAGEGAEAASGGSSAVAGSAGGKAGAAAGATGGASGEGGNGDTPPSVGGASAGSGAGAIGGNAGTSAAGGASGGVGGGAGTAGSNSSGGSASGDAGTSSGGVGGATAGAGMGGASAGTGGAVAGTGGSGGGAGIGNTTGCGELITNGSFEQGRSSWDVMSSWANFELNVHELIAERGSADLLAEGVVPQSGDFLAWVGGVPDDDREHSLFLSQPIVISDNVIDLAFSGFLLVKSAEPVNPSYDEVYIELLDAEYEPVWQFGAWSNQHQGPNWVPMSSIDPHPDDFELILGRPLRFAVYSRTDDNTISHFFFDALSLIATCSP